jgi:hypothetical protein
VIVAVSGRQAPAASVCVCTIELSWPFAGLNDPVNPASVQAARAFPRDSPTRSGTVLQIGAGVGLGDGVGVGGGVGAAVGRAVRAGVGVGVGGGMLGAAAVSLGAALVPLGVSVEADAGGADEVAVPVGLPDGEPTADRLGPPIATPDGGGDSVSRPAARGDRAPSEMVSNTMTTPSPPNAS